MTPTFIIEPKEFRRLHEYISRLTGRPQTTEPAGFIYGWLLSAYLGSILFHQESQIIIQITPLHVKTS